MSNQTNLDAFIIKKNTKVELTKQHYLLKSYFEEVALLKLRLEKYH